MGHSCFTASLQRTNLATVQLEDLSLSQRRHTKHSGWFLSVSHHVKQALHSNFLSAYIVKATRPPVLVQNFSAPGISFPRILTYICWVVLYLFLSFWGFKHFWVLPDTCTSQLTCHACLVDVLCTST